MTSGDKLLLLAGLGLAVVAVVYWRKSAPRPMVTGPAGSYGDPLLTNFGTLPDARTVPLGTISPDGQWHTVQSRMQGATPRWEPTGALGGGVPGMIT